MSDTYEDRTDDTERITPGDLRIKSSDGGPVLEIDGEFSVLLRTFVDVDGDTRFESAAERFKTDVDSDGDNGSWWNIWPGNEIYPLISIQPEVVRDEE